MAHPIADRAQGVAARRLEELVADIKQAVARISPGWVEAEVAEAKTSGAHCYVTLTGGEDLRVSAKFFGRSRVRAERSLGGPIARGQRLAVRVDRVDFYGPHGSLAVLCSDARHIGEGELLRRRQEALDRLAREGLVDRPRRALPRFPRAIGLVCGDPSDAYHDVVGGIRDRFPAVDMIVCPSLVQGAAAPAGLVRALAALLIDGRAEVIVLARGGGSVADLAAFDDEELCRIVARSPVPVVAAIGHTANRPVAYEVAEATANVPREVAQVVAPSRADVTRELGDAGRAFTRAGARVSASGEPLVASRARLRAAQALEHQRGGVRAAAATIGRLATERRAEEEGRLARSHQRLDARHEGLSSDRLVGLSRRLEAARVAGLRDAELGSTGVRLASARRAVELRLERDGQALAQGSARGRRAGAARLADLARDAARTARLIGARDPVGHGYAVVRRDGLPVADAAALEAGDRVQVDFHDGSAAAAVERVNIEPDDDDA